MGLVKAVILSWGFHYLVDTGDETFLVVVTGRKGCIALGI